MALHPNFPDDPHAILDPAIRWFPADEVAARKARRSTDAAAGADAAQGSEVVARRGYEDATETSKSLLRWWFLEPHLTPAVYATGSLMQEFRYFFAQRERWRRSSI